MKKILIIILTLIVGMLGYANDERVDRILETKVLRVGTTGDYKPFTYKNKDGSYSGYDIDVARHIGDQLGVKVVFVDTTWKGLTDDLSNDKFDIAMGGITRNIKRKKVAEFSNPYLTYGKTPIVRVEDREKYKSLSDIDKEGVIVGVNIGGTNEKFADKYIKKATIKKYKGNLEVPEAVKAGDVDVMISETPEAIYYELNDPKLASPMTDTPMTKSQLGYLIHKGDYGMVSIVNFILHDMKLNGLDKKLMEKNMKKAD